LGFEQTLPPANDQKTRRGTDAYAMPQETASTGGGHEVGPAVAANAFDVADSAHRSNQGDERKPLVVDEHDILEVRARCGAAFPGWRGIHDET
jgi:hypothetical protein